MKKRIAMFVYGPLWPVRMGSQRVIVEIAKFLSSLPDVKLKIVTIADAQHEAEYRQICDEVVFIPPTGRWSFWNILNKFVSRMGIDAWLVACTTYAYRKKVRKAILGSDYIFLNYAIWNGLLPSRIIASRTMAITHDLLFYRRASFSQRQGLVQRWLLRLNKFFEMRLLRKFNKVGVFADYEKAILIKEGFDESTIVQLGMPISVKREDGITKEFDFIFVGGDSFQNKAGLECFFDRVAPLLERPISFAVAGDICGSEFWDSAHIPDHVSVVRLGHVDNLPHTMARGLIGVGTVPYGSGIKVKVVESIMSGLPMVLTDSGEEGVPVFRDAVINIDREGKDEQSRRLNKWLDDRAETIKIGMEGAKMLSEVFNPSAALHGIIACFDGGGGHLSVFSPPVYVCRANMGRLLKEAA